MKATEQRMIARTGTTGKSGECQARSEADLPSALSCLRKPMCATLMAIQTATTEKPTMAVRTTKTVSAAKTEVKRASQPPSMESMMALTGRPRFVRFEAQAGSMPSCARAQIMRPAA